MKNLISSFVLMISIMALLGCESNKTQTSTSKSPKKTKEEYLVSLETPHGTMLFVLFDETPKHKDNFIKLAKKGYFDGSLFHRVIDNFMIQGGDPSSKGAKAEERLGNGGPDYTIPAEFNPNLIHQKGVIAAAREGDRVNPSKASNGSQFYIVKGKQFTDEQLSLMKINYAELGKLFIDFISKEENKALQMRYAQLQAENNLNGMQELMVSYKDSIEQVYQVELDGTWNEKHKQIYKTVGGYPSLDGNYTVFGMMVQGFEVLDKISAEKTDTYDRPLNDMDMKITVKLLSKKEITKQFGYTF